MHRVGHIPVDLDTGDFFLLFIEVRDNYTEYNAFVCRIWEMDFSYHLADLFVVYRFPKTCLTELSSVRMFSQIKR